MTKDGQPNKKVPRGIRLNNPGNIDRNTTKWQGMSKDQSGDSRFVVFDHAKWGIRALAKTLMTYQSKHGLNTIRGIINRWAPPVENDTGSYVNAVAKAVGVKPDQKIDVTDAEIMFPLVEAIIKHENGVQPYEDGLLVEGIQAAGVRI